MGQEAVAVASYKGQVSEGKALLETDELVFRGEFRLRIPLREIRSLEAGGGVLSLTLPDGVAELELGAEGPQPTHAAGQARREARRAGRGPRGQGR